MNAKQDTLVLTIGHSTRTLEGFIDLIMTNKANMVIDIRTIPRSRKNPQFNKDFLPGELNRSGINYRHFSGLGGLRHPLADSLNAGWHNSSFRGFADYMQTKEFEENINTLVDLARRERLVLMCAEAVPWRCHRSLIADALLVRGLKVEHIIGKKDRRLHVLTTWAKVVGNSITYPELVEVQKAN